MGEIPKRIVGFRQEFKNSLAEHDSIYVINIIRISEQPQGILGCTTSMGFVSD